MPKKDDDRDVVLLSTGETRVSQEMVDKYGIELIKALNKGTIYVCKGKIPQN